MQPLLDHIARDKQVLLVWTEDGKLPSLNGAAQCSDTDVRPRRAWDVLPDIKLAAEFRQADHLKQRQWLVGMRISDFQLRLGRRVIMRTEALEEVLDDPKGFDRLDMLGLLLLDERVERGHDVFRIIRVEESIPIVYRDVVLAGEAVDCALTPPVLSLFEFNLPLLFTLGQVGIAIALLLGHTVDKRLEADDVVLHG